MKKNFLLTIFLSVWLLSTSANAICVPAKSVGNEMLGNIVTNDAGKPGFAIPLEYTDRYFEILLSDISAFPFEHVYEIIGGDPEHNTYGFYSSMGCTDITCLNPAHTHWCPNSICQNPEHGHSPAEYSKAATFDPSCPCHKH